MTLDEAIKHCEEVATQCTNTNKKCSNDHIQLANWLKELTIWLTGNFGVTKLKMAHSKMNAQNGEVRRRSYIELLYLYFSG